jgi:Tfp pilus assembly protein PilF
MQQLQKMLADSPNDCFLLHALALENIKIENHKEALHIFERVISIDYKYIGSYYHLAKVQQILNKKNAALNTYQEGIKIAQQLGDFHALNELRNAMDEMIEDEDE